jgi:hypothetical protein
MMAQLLMRRPFGRFLLLLTCVSATFLITACSRNDTEPTPVSSITIGQPTPAAGAVIQTTGTLPGAFITRGSGQLSIPMTVTSGREVPWAQLYVYLLTNNTSGYCGQNLPDAPTWGPFAKGQTVSVSISGFQVFQLPCQVTGVRAMLHTRNTGLLTPPISSETVAEATMAVSYTIR